MRRKEMVGYFQGMPTVCDCDRSLRCFASLGRLLTALGHEVELIPPQLVNPYVKRGKNDAADAEALCEAMSRPTIRFVPMKSADQQAVLMLVGMRERAVAAQTQLSKTIRGHAAELGLTAGKGTSHIPLLLERIMIDETIPALARDLFASLADEFLQLDGRRKEVEAKLMAWYRNNECCRRLAKIPGVGPIGAVLLVMKAPAPELFASGRPFAAWMGLTPEDHSTAGKVRLGVITRAGIAQNTGCGRDRGVAAPANGPTQMSERATTGVARRSTRRPSFQKRITPPARSPRPTCASCGGA
ncbi:transposase [Rhizobium mongolense]